MGTSNFHRVNATKVFAIATDEPDEFFYQDMKENAISLLNEIPYFRERDGSDPYELRSFPSDILGAIGKSKAFGGCDVSARIIAVTRAGYYEGLCFDWHFETALESEWTLEELINEFKYYSKHKGLASVHAKAAYKWLQATRKELIEAVEKVFEQCATHSLQEVARFSNGETFYAASK